MDVFIWCFGCDAMRRGAMGVCMISIGRAHLLGFSSVFTEILKALNSLKRDA